MSVVAALRSSSSDALHLPSTSSTLRHQASRSESSLTQERPVSWGPSTTSQAALFQNRPTLSNPPAVPAKAYDYRRDTRRHSLNTPSSSAGVGLGMQPLPPLPAHVLNPNLGAGPASARRYRDRHLLPLPPSPLARDARTLDKSLPTLPAATVPRSPRYTPSPLSASATVEEADEDEDDPGCKSGSSSESADGTPSTAMTTPASSSPEKDSPLASYFGLAIRRRTVDEAKKRHRMSLPVTMGNMSLSLNRRPSVSSAAAVTPAPASGTLTSGPASSSTGTANRRVTFYSENARLSYASSSSLHEPTRAPQVPPKSPIRYGHSEPEDEPFSPPDIIPSVDADPSKNWMTSVPAPTFSRSQLPGVIMPLAATQKNREKIASRNSSTSSLGSGAGSLSDLHLPHPTYASSHHSSLRSSSGSLHRGSGGSSWSSLSDLMPPVLRRGGVSGTGAGKHGGSGPYGSGSVSYGSRTSSSLMAKSTSSFGSAAGSAEQLPTIASRLKSASTPEVRGSSAVEDPFVKERDGMSNESLALERTMSPTTVESDASATLYSSSSVGHGAYSSSIGHGTSSLGHGSSSLGHRSSFTSHPPPSSTMHSHHELGVIVEHESSSSINHGDKDLIPSPLAVSSPPLPRRRSRNGKSKNKVAVVAGKKLRSAWRKVHQFADGIREIQQQLRERTRAEEEEWNRQREAAAVADEHTRSQTLPNRRKSSWSTFSAHGHKYRLSMMSSTVDLNKPLPPPSEAPLPPSKSFDNVRSFERTSLSRTRPSSVSGFEKPLPVTPESELGRMVSVKAPKMQTA